MSATPDTRADEGRRLPLVLRNRAFGAVWLGQVLTQAAVRMFQVGVSWWLVAYAVDDGRGLASGLFMAVSSLPAVALAPVVARAVARIAHRSVLRAAAALAGAAAAALAVWAWSSDLPLAAAYGATLALAACQAFFDPCLTTSVPELVDDEDIETATGFELSTQSLAGLGGALLGALIVDRAGVAGLAAGCAAAYLAAALLIAGVRFRTAAAHGENDGGAGEAATPRKRTLRSILRELPYVRRILVCFAAANLFTTAVFVVIPLYTRNVLGDGGGTVALLEASLGAGTLIGSSTGTRVPGRPTVTGAYCLGLMALALALPGLVAQRLVISCCLAVAGWCVGVIGVRFVALFQRLVPTADKPGFFAVMQAVLGATFPVASLLFGLAGDHLSAQTLCLVQAAGLVPAACALALLGARTPEPAADRPTAEAATGPAADRTPEPVGGER
ncbi:MFS transporter [Streptomyces sp. NBC_01142]|uniref:MFS transporter n=1 Tax=Streptomyces sp. NBC_01142 TaxID=2975865 RepID=UPI00225126B2|nr:MFS transporter [Streptomyces sp. NBC_01142]MCX4825739.1 MFS transporter [Streptomyces sp. NBC_01142]